MSDTDRSNRQPSAPGTKATAMPKTAAGWWALGLSAIGLAAWIVLPAATAVFREEYSITNSGVMPLIGAALIVTAAVFNILCLWLWKERSALNIVSAAVTIPTALFFGFMVLGQLGAGTSGIPATKPDVGFARVDSSSREGKVVVLSLKADPQTAARLGRPFDSKYAAASVRVDQNTAIINGETIEDVLGGKHIDVWFTGAVDESNPVSATAATVVIDRD